LTPLLVYIAQTDVEAEIVAHVVITPLLLVSVTVNAVSIEVVNVVSTKPETSRRVWPLVLSELNSLTPLCPLDVLYEDEGAAKAGVTDIVAVPVAPAVALTMLAVP